MHSNIRNQAIAAREIVFDAFDRLDDLLDDMSTIESTVRKWCPLLDNGLGLKKVIGRDFAEIDDDLFARRLSEARSEIVAMRDERMAEIDELLFGIRTRSDDASNKSFKMIDEMEFSWIELNFIEFGERSYQYAVEAACNVSRDALPKWVSSFFSDHFIKHVPQTKQEVDSLRLNAKYFFETCPFTKSIEEALRKRKMIEMARVIRDIPNAIEAGYWDIHFDVTHQNQPAGDSRPMVMNSGIVEPKLLEDEILSTKKERTDEEGKKNPKFDRNDWLLEQRGMDQEPKHTEKELSNLLAQKCIAEKSWTHIEPRSIATALREAYKRQTGQLWQFDARGKRSVKTENAQNP